MASGALNNLSGSNTYSGNIIANVASTIGSTAGTLTLTGGINNGGHLLTITGAGNTTVSHAITGAGNLTYSGGGSGILNLAVGNPSYSGTTTVSSGALQISNGMTGSATGTGSVMVSGTARSAARHHQRPGDRRQSAALWLPASGKPRCQRASSRTSAAI